MKKVTKTISLIIVAAISIIMFISKDKINVFAEITSMYDIKIGSVFKNGTIIPYNEPFDNCFIDPTNIYCGEYSSNLCILLKQPDGSGDYLCKRGPDDTERELIINNETSEYWKLESYGGGSGLWMNFVPYNYKAPKFSLECDPNKVEPTKSSICTIKVKYITKFNDIKFSLDTGDYEISNVTAGDFFEDLQLNNNIYSLKSREIIEEGEEITVTLATFKVTSNDEKNIDVENNIKVKNINYKDAAENKNITEISTTVKQEIKEQITPTKSDDEIIKPTISDDEIDEGKDLPNENPKTSDKSYLILYAILVISVSISSFIIVFKKGNTKL